MRFLVNEIPIPRIAMIALLVISIVFTLDLLSVIGIGLWHPAVPKVDAVIVLGARVGTPALTNRTLAGLKYYQKGKTNTIVLSGGRGSDEPTSEAQAMKTVVENYVAKTHGKMLKIVIDPTSTDTLQNLSDSRALIPHAKSVLIISDTYHVARAVVIAKHAGFQSVYWDSPAPWYYSAKDLVHYYVREAVGMIVYVPRLALLGG